MFYQKLNEHRSPLDLWVNGVLSLAFHSPCTLRAYVLMTCSKDTWTHSSISSLLEESPINIHLQSIKAKQRLLRIILARDKQVKLHWIIKESVLVFTAKENLGKMSLLEKSNWGSNERRLYLKRVKRIENLDKMKYLGIGPMAFEE